MTAQEYFDQGVAAYETQDFEQAIICFTKAIELNLEYASAYNSRGNTYDDQKQYTKAIEDYTKVIDLNPKFSEAYLSRAIAFSKQKQYAKAIEDYTKAIELNPEYTSYYNRAIVYSEQKQYTKAIEDSTKAIELNPDFTPAYYNRGNNYNDQKQYTKAIEDYTKAIELNPENASAYNNRGNVYNTQKQYIKAIEDYTKAIELNPENASAYNNRGNVYNTQKQYIKAIEDYTKAIELNPDNTSAYSSNRGIVYNTQKQYIKAIEDFTKAIELNPDFTLAYYRRGSAYSAQKQFKKAVEDFTQAIELNPDFTLAYLSRGSIYEVIGENALAQADWVRFIALDEGEIIAKYFSTLAVFFRDVAATPYVVRQMVEKVPVAEALLSFQGLLSQTEAQCRVVDAYLAQVGTLREAATKQSAAYYALLAYVHFEMGTVGTAFQIFDEILDNQLDHELSLREEYYYLRSTEAFQEPIESIRANALEKAQDFYESFEANTASPTAQTEMYYAGLLFFYTGQVEQAHHCFTKVFLQFPPAAYMQVLTLEKLGRREDLDKKIERIRRWKLSQPQPQFLHGFAPRALLLDEPDFLAPIHAYLLHTQIVEAVQLVRQEGDAPYQSPPLWEAFTLSEVALLRLRTQLFAHALMALDKQYHQQLSADPVAELSRWRQNQAEKDFAELKTLASNSEALEIRIAELIKTWDTDPVYFEYYLKYFYCCEQLGVLATHSLYHYLKVFKQAKASTSEINATLWEKLTEESSKELFTVSTSALVTVTTGIATAGAFLSIPMAVVAGVFTKVVLQKADIFIQHLKDKNQLPDYASFKYQLVNELRSEIENQSTDNAAAYEEYIIPELKKWVPKETNW